MTGDGSFQLREISSENFFGFKENCALKQRFKRP
jgi:hypothetical protein